MARSKNAQLAVDLFNELQSRYNWTPETAWHGIARMLLSCEIYRGRWEKFHDVVLYIDSNRFTAGDSGPHATLRRAEQLTAYLPRSLESNAKTFAKTSGFIGSMKRSGLSSPTIHWVTLFAP